MKIIKILLICFCFLVTNKAFALHQLYADMDGISIPYGTKIELEMAQNLTTKGVEQGEIFQAHLTKDIYVNSRLVLPMGTTFRGRISSIKTSRKLSRPAILYLTLDHLVTKRGYHLPINAGISDNFGYILKHDGALTTNGNYFKATAQDIKKSGKIVKKCAKWGVKSGEELFTGGKYFLTPISTTGGVIACVCSGSYNIIANLFRHGDEIVIKSGSKFNIILLSKLDIPS